jgi:cell division protein FtsB
VDYSRLAAFLIEAVKSQQTELRTQQGEIRQLRARIEQLTYNVSALQLGATFKEFGFVSRTIADDWPEKKTRSSVRMARQW